MVSDDAPTVSARFIYEFTTIHGGRGMIHPDGATNAQDAFTIQHGVSAVQAGSGTVVSWRNLGQTEVQSYCIRDESVPLGLIPIPLR